jgi:hypothetical protein
VGMMWVRCGEVRNGFLEPLSYPSPPRNKERGTAQSSEELGVLSFPDAERHLTWLRQRVRMQIPNLLRSPDMADLTMSLCLRPRWPRPHRDAGVDFTGDL